MSESNKLRASATRKGGVDLARCTNLQKLPQKRSNKYATWGSLGPICCNLESRPRLLERRFAINFAQKIRSPIGAPRSTKFGVLDHFICTGKEFKSPLLNSSHFGSLMNRPKWGPCSLIIAITLATAFLVPATTPSSMYHLW